MPIYIVNMGNNACKSVSLADFDIAGYYQTSHRNIDCIQKEIERNLNSLYIMNKRARMSLKLTDFLMSVNQFSHCREPLHQLFDVFINALHDFCSAQVSFNVKLNEAGQCEIAEFPYQTYPPDELSEQLADILKPAIEKAKLTVSPQIELPQDDDIFIYKLNLLFSKEIKAYLAYPICSYGQVISVVFCALTSHGLKHISVGSMNVLKESAKQLTLLLERRCSENKDKSRYIRLKTTLSTLLLNEEQPIKRNAITQEFEPNLGKEQEEQGVCSVLNLLNHFESTHDFTNNLIKCLENYDDLIAYIDEHETLLKQRLNTKKSIEDMFVLINHSRESILRVRDLINDLNAFIQVKELEASPFYLQHLFDETLRLISYDIRNSVNIKLNIKDNIRLNTHRGFFQQILFNLIKNAIQAVTSPDAPQEMAPQVIISVKNKHKKLVVSVEDNGPGISKAEIDKVFLPFFTTKAIGEGVGLGLSVTHNLVMKLGGKIKVTSDTNKGAKFVITFPFSEVACKQRLDCDD
ncbi:sensor histidine kinase [Alteromonas sp. a30]|uniref:sensor histidine kinase n=1 Tax=Alteromonas sp. a30 TaxID=2730917 RepID=UPI00228002BC|nr:HAMP domain-containing sensor histidine kinase [Alteromonas sp. a30]MCY7296451.1 HAMP domain-containing histidine kinase [Alteromonas sp. a30]